MVLAGGNELGRNANPINLLTFLALSITGCFESPFQGEGSLTGVKSTQRIVAKVESTSGKTKATFDSSLQVAQTISAASNQKLTGTSVTLEPGTLNLDVQITIEESIPLEDTNVFSELGLAESTNVGGSGQGVIIRPSVDAAATKPFTLNIPLPSSSDAALNLQDSAINYDLMVVIYKIFTAEGGLKSGLIPRSKISIINGAASFQAPNFGAFQTVILDVVVEEEIETISAEPIRNVNNVVVVDEEGVKTEEEIVEKEVIPLVTWSELSLAANPITRVLTASAVPSETVSDCKLRFKETESALIPKEVFPVDPSLATTTLPNLKEHFIYARFACFDAQERLTQTPWSGPITVPDFLESVPVLTWETPQVVFDATSRTAAVSGSVNGAVSECKLGVKESATSSSPLYEVLSAEVVGTKFIVSNEEAHSIYVRFSCLDEYGRTSESGWSQAFSIPSKVATLEVKLSAAKATVGEYVGIYVSGGLEPYQLGLSKPTAADIISSTNQADINTEFQDATFVIQTREAINPLNIAIADSSGQSYSISLEVTLATLTLSLSNSVPKTGELVGINVSGGLEPYSLTLANTTDVELLTGEQLVDVNADLANSTYVIKALLPNSNFNIKVTDTLSQSVEQDISITLTPLTISADKTDLVPNEAVGFTIAGGIPPYSYVLEDAYGYPSGYGSLDETNFQYTAPNFGITEVLVVTDQSQNTSSVSFKIYSPPSISGTPSKTRPGGQLSLTVYDGFPPLTYSADSWPTITSSNATGGSLVVNAAANATGTANVTVTDSVGRSSTATLTILQSGELDETFGSLGTKSVSVPNNTGSGNYFYDIAEDSAGHLVVGGYMDRCCISGYYDHYAVGSFTPKGDLVTSFGVNGGNSFLPAANLDNQAKTMTILPDDSIVLAGVIPAGSPEIGLIKLTPQGNLDTTAWGGATGIIREIIVATTLKINDIEHRVIDGPTTQIVTAGSKNGSWYLSAFNDADGSVDAEYAIATAITGELRDMLVLGDGSTIAVGSIGSNFGVALLDSFGILASSFNVGSPATYTTGQAEKVAVDGNGHYVVVGTDSPSGDSSWVITRLLSNGSLDTSFGGTGIVTYNPSSGKDVALAVTIFPDNSMIVGGSALEDNTTSGWAEMVKFKADGTIDTSWGNNGKYIYDPPSISRNFLFVDIMYHMDSSGVDRVFAITHAPGASSTGTVISVVP